MLKKDLKHTHQEKIHHPRGT
uniref:Uncharacterized protein n=1 Tax=Arundo donax TaxID=35708 RepID=A0A0A9BJQ9_ARUDO